MKPIVVVAFLILITQSCAVYTPQTSPSIQIRKKGEIEFNLGGNISSFLLSPGINSSVSYGLTNKLRTQIFSSYISSGTTHLQALTGYDFYINDKSWLILSGGYFYGIGNVRYQQIASSYKGSPNYIGTYHSLFGKVQYSKSFRKSKGNWGITCTIGNFRPNYSVQYHQDSNYSNKNEIMNQKGLLLEPYVYVHWDISEKLGLSVSYSNAWIKPLNQKNDDYPNQYKLDYNVYGNIGLNLNYKLVTIKNK